MKTTVGLFVALVGLFSQVAEAGSLCCDHCGCQSCVQRVCRRVCEMKEVKSYEYQCKCEEFCVPTCSHGRCGHDCGTCSAEVRTKKKLLKVEVVKKVPTYKWVVEHVCVFVAADVHVDVRDQAGAHALVERSEAPVGQRARDFF